MGGYVVSKEHHQRRFHQLRGLESDSAQPYPSSCHARCHTVDRHYDLNDEHCKEERQDESPHHAVIDVRRDYHDRHAESRERELLFYIIVAVFIL